MLHDFKNTGWQSNIVYATMISLKKNQFDQHYEPGRNIYE